MKSIESSTIEYLNRIEGLSVQTDISLSKISNWRVGGRARVLVQPKTLAQIIQLQTFLEQKDIANLVIGNTTNLLFTDSEMAAVFIQIGSGFSDIKNDGVNIVAQAGIWVPKLARYAMQAGLTGIEHTCGIPGTLGGLVVMNGGSQRKGIGDHVSYVKTVTKQGGLKSYSKDECQFSYRSSIFQRLEETIVEVGLELKHSTCKQRIRKEMLGILRARSKKFPRKLPNCGSVFVSNPAMYKEYGPPGKVIEDCGLKGMIKGGAQISSDHANFIVNNGGASSEDILYLINCIRYKVFEETGCLMKVEAKFVNYNGKVQGI